MGIFTLGVYHVPLCGQAHTEKISIVTRHNVWGGITVYAKVSCVVFADYVLALEVDTCRNVKFHDSVLLLDCHLESKGRCALVVCSGLWLLLPLSGHPALCLLPQVLLRDCGSNHVG